MSATLHCIDSGRPNRTSPVLSRIDTAATSVWSPAAIGRAATLALHDELALAPKPGLVSFVDTGSHDDMDAHTFMRSLFALRSYFVHIAELGARHAPFEQLERCGIAAEAHMLAATGGINTHRGAIFMLGLLCAAAGATQADGRPLSTESLRAALQHHWGVALNERCARTPQLPGGLAARRHGLRSASQEAALGLPVLFETAVPAWCDARACGLAGTRLHLQVFFTILAELDDSNLAHRGGMAGLQFARDQARGFLQRGGTTRAEALDDAGAIHRSFVARRLSPGGCADTLSAACLLDRLGAIT
jgi:triphosphoribosyl-dephospho-CoA synthase